MTRLQKAQNDSQELTGVLFRLEDSLEKGTYELNTNNLDEARKLCNSILRTINYLEQKVVGKP